jgi:F-type H+-transporting ATPase subunit b
MKRFLYKPILAAIDAREQKVAAQLADAERKKAEAKTERNEFQRKNKEFDEKRSALIGKATDEAKIEAQRLMEEARKAADALSRKRQATLRSEAQNLNQALMLRTGQEVFAIARKTLTDLAGVSLEEKMTEVFCAHVRALDEATKARLAKPLTTASEPASLRSAFELPEEQRRSIQKTLNETFSADIRLHFEIEPEQVSGIELITGGQKVAWSVTDYLSTLEKGVAELLQENHATAETTSELKTDEE